MNKNFWNFLLLGVVVLVCFDTTRSCSVEIPPLRKDFRQAKSVFAGKVISIREHELSKSEKALVPEHWRDWHTFSKVLFDIERKWKGDFREKIEFTAVAYFPCGCPGAPVNQFEVGKDFLVFIYEGNFLTVCQSEKMGSKYVAKKMKRLDGFWFRTWARIYPF